MSTGLTLVIGQLISQSKLSITSLAMLANQNQGTLLSDKVDRPRIKTNLNWSNDFYSYVFMSYLGNFFSKIDLESLK